MLRHRARILAFALATVAGVAATTARPAPAAAHLDAIMTAGPAFFKAADVSDVAAELNFGSLSPGIDGGVFVRFGNENTGWSGQSGVAVFWTRRRHTEDLTSENGLLIRRDTAFRLTALGVPVTAVYSVRQAWGSVYAGIGIAYYVATVTAESDVSGSSWFPTDGTAASGERSAKGPGAHLLVGYERQTPIGGIGGGVLLRRAKFPTDEARGASDFDVDLSGVSVFVSLSIHASK